MKLYARIWLAIIVTVVMFALIVGFFIKQHTAHIREQFRNQSLEASLRDGPRGAMRDMEIRNEVGKVIGRATRRVEPLDINAPPDLPPRTRGFSVRLDNGQHFEMELPPRPHRAPRLAPPWYFSPWGLFAVLGLMALAVTLCVYPIVRRLTRRLETLQQGVEAWGAGQLSARVALDGRDEVGFLAQRFNHAASQVEALVISHKSLLANASHELRSPLARIRMALALLHSSPDKIHEINQNIEELNGLIEEILLASRLDSQGTSIGAPEFFDLMGLAAEECARTSAELHVADNTQGSFDMQGHPKLIRRLLRNLLENAQRHNDSTQGAVGLTLTQDKQQFVITVRDHGAGVPLDECERIFEPFYRAKNASEQGGGVGLGLALVKTIAHRHGGSAACIPTQGAGGCFIVKLAASSHVGG